MYLKSLTLRGFKSFASSTTLNLEPGITCVVGPNGSGKSNVVDALAWVMGEQGAKSLRGGKMEDVIFAGTTGRPPLGRAEVLLTIDNSDGALPIEYSEVTISRTMFRSGGSEYAINGQSCRLLDVQELLSDSGIGREMHVIVGQGQLDSVLHATPEDRRGFVEEAAGVLKHRKRKEKALRKLDATQGNLTRLQDLLTEIRRQLKPLGRQAEVARRAATIQADARDARARLLADEIITARTTMQVELADETELKARRQDLESQIEAARAEEITLETKLRDEAPRVTLAQETWFALSGLRERMRGTLNLAQERLRAASEEVEDMTPGRDPDQLDAEADRLSISLTELAEDVNRAQTALDEAIAERQSTEAAYTEEERRIASTLRASADRREGLARLAGQVNALRARSAAFDSEIARLESARVDALKRAEHAHQEYVTLETSVAGLDAGERGLDAQFDQAQAAKEQAQADLDAVKEQVLIAQRDVAALTARVDALRLNLEPKDGAGALLSLQDTMGSLLGSAAGLMTIRPGFEPAIAAAMGSAADAIAVNRVDGAVDAIETLKSRELGRAGIIVAGGPAEDEPWPALPAYATYAVDVITSDAQIDNALRRILLRVAVVDSVADARRLVSDLPTVTAVTREGDVLSAHFARGGSASSQSLIEAQSAFDVATGDLAQAHARVESLSFDVARLSSAFEQASREAEVALEALHESDAELAAVSENLGHLNATIKSAKAEAERLEAAKKEAEAAHERDVAGLAELETRLAEASEASEEDPDTTVLESLGEQARENRQKETDARLALRTLEERVRALSDQINTLRESAEAERQAIVRAQQRREQRRREAIVAGEVVAAGTEIVATLERSISRASSWRNEIEQSRRSIDQKLADLRAKSRELAAELDKVTDSVHRDEIARAEQRLRLENLEMRALEELGTEVDILVAEYGPDVLVPQHPTEDNPDPEPLPFDRDRESKRLKIAEKELALLGKVNPLALEEFSALEERHKFLSEQLDDLKKTRHDLLEIVDEVDAKVVEVFTAAWQDVEREFSQVFSRLFPGGEGRLVLTDPSDMLTSGIDVEARPAGKKVKRLSLLSGGERSLVAVAFLVSLFKARPSPFYILDEVEAALDDTNLGRLLEIYEELRENSQLVVITHQKRTMEVADALYGVSMRGDGVSAVISQRLRDGQDD